jgi:uncharacterized protein YbaP (TraB family)
MRACWLSLLLVVLCASAAWPSWSATAPVAESTLDEIVVTGRLPGPGLWKISKDGHVLWVLGTLAPLPRRMQWDSIKVQARIAQSQEVLMAPVASIKVDIGLIGGLLLVPKALAARRNPERAMLVDVVPAALYARWSVLKQRYLKRNRAVEKQRPILAASKLYERALKRVGLSQRDVVTRVVRKAAKRNKVLITEPKLELKIADPRQALAEFASSELNDLPCFEQTLERVEADLGTMKARANAWARGDLAALRRLPFVDQRRACDDAILNTQIARSRGMDDVRERLRSLWLETAISAIARNESTFAILRVNELLRDGGVAQQLQSLGYTVQAP